VPVGFFQARRERELVAYDREGTSPKNKNATVRRICWGASRKTLAVVRGHI
jgi:hypothetical protein